VRQVLLPGAVVGRQRPGLGAEGVEEDHLLRRRVIEQAHPVADHRRVRELRHGALLGDRPRPAVDAPQERRRIHQLRRPHAGLEESEAHEAVALAVVDPAQLSTGREAGFIVALRSKEPGALLARLGDELPLLSTTETGKKVLSNAVWVNEPTVGVGLEVEARIGRHVEIPFSQGQSARDQDLVFTGEDHRPDQLGAKNLVFRAAVCEEHRVEPRIVGEAQLSSVGVHVALIVGGDARSFVDKVGVELGLDRLYVLARHAALEEWVWISRAALRPQADEARAIVGPGCGVPDEGSVQAAPRPGAVSAQLPEAVGVIAGHNGLGGGLGGGGDGGVGV
jgi:hypothetical protein